jgi:long-chain acyl-CoA synthetase
VPTDPRHLVSRVGNSFFKDAKNRRSAALQILAVAPAIAAVCALPGDDFDILFSSTNFQLRTLAKQAPASTSEGNKRMEKIWLKSYPPGVPHDVQPEQYRSVAHLLEESFRKHASSPFSVCMDQWMTYGELERRSAALGAYLQSLGLAPGARVAIMLPNIPQFGVTMAAVLRAGYTCVNVNPLYTARELEHQLKDSGATAIVILENFAHTLAEVIDHTAVQHVVMASMGDLLGFWYGKWITFAVRHLAKMVPAYDLPLSNGRKVVTFKKALSLGEHKSLAPSQATLDSIAFLQYTGGTTGLSKGAVLTHRNIVAATLQAEAWFTPALAKIGDVSRANSVAALPLYHIFALTLCLLAIRQGSSLTLIPNPRDIPKFVAELKKRPFHMLPAVNTLFNALLQNPQFRALDFSHLCVSQAGGMAASEGTAKQWQKVTGSTMIEGWGMSETCAIGTNNPVNATEFSGTIGLPLPGIDIAIKDDEGNSLPQGASGEICIRGPNVMTGYYNQPEENAKAFTADGFMRTGDIGIMDERGFTRIIDRKKDMILVSGFNVFPNELEQVISLCPGVMECAAIGVPDEKQGEAIKVFVIKSDPALTEDDVVRYCHDNLTGYKRPKYIEFRDELPKSNVGKILRRQLRTTP